MVPPDIYFGVPKSFTFPEVLIGVNRSVELIVGESKDFIHFDAWNDGFENAGAVGSLGAEIKTFNACFSEEAKEGNIYDLIYIPDIGLEVKIEGVRKAVIPGLPFKEALFSIWLGDDPCDDDLKDELLGGKE